MNVAFSVGPVLAYKPPDDRHFILDLHWWLETAGNWALLVSGVGMVQRGNVLRKSISLIPRAPAIIRYSVPFTIGVGGPGLLLFALDVAFYKGSGPAFQWIAEQYDLLNRWLEHVDSAELLQLLGPARYAELTQNGVVTDVTILVSMPPAQLSDP